MKNKSGLITISIITVALLAIFSIVSWVIPFPNHTSVTFIVAYVAAMVIIFLQGILSVVAMTYKKDKNLMIAGIPVVRFCIIFTIVQLVVSSIFYTVNSLISDTPFWIIIVVESIIYLLYIIFLSLGFFFKHRIKDFQNNKPSTIKMDIAKAKISIIVNNNKNEGVAKQLEDLMYSIKGSDAVSNEMSEQYEDKLIEELGVLSSMVDENKSSDELLQEIDKVSKQLFERNSFCKLGKK